MKAENVLFLGKLGILRKENVVACEAPLVAVQSVAFSVKSTKKISGFDQRVLLSALFSRVKRYLL